MTWTDLSEDARQALGDLNIHRPVSERDSRLTGWSSDGEEQVHYSADDLRRIAAHFMEAADWLDKRAKETQ